MKKLLSTLLSVVIAFSALTFAVPLTANAAGSSYSSATNYTMGKKAYGNIRNSSQSDYYKFTISTSGKVNFSINADLECTDYYIYDASHNKVWSKTYVYWNYSTKKSVVNEDVYLNSGTYYFVIDPPYSACGAYNFTAKFTSAGESFKEVSGGSNNYFDTASRISLNKSYKGQISENDSVDYYKFSLSSSGRVNLKLIASIHEMNYHLYDANYNEVSGEEYISWDSSSKKININHDFYLTSGTYYFAVEKCYDYSGFYNFSTVYTSANESFKETQNCVNNSFDTASKISLNKTYKGQIADNDPINYYKFTLSSSGKVNLKLTASIKQSGYYLYDAEYNEIWSEDCLYWDSSSKKGNLNVNLYLTSGTYYLSVKKWYNCSGFYYFSTAFTSAGESFKETLNNKHDNFDAANKISVNKKYIGQIADNDSSNYYKFTVPATRKITIKVSAGIYCSSYHIYDSNYNTVWDRTYCYWDNSSKKMNFTESTTLKKGTYYFKVEKYSNYCGFYNFTISDGTAATSVKLSKTSATLGVGQSTTLKATVSPSKANKKCTWATSNKKVATVTSGGKVVAKGVGTATITAKTANGKKATCKITVKKAPKSVKLSKTTISLKKGQKYTLKATLSSGSAGSKAWTTSNKKVAAVSTKGVVTAKARGTSYITVKTYNGKTAKCKVLVK